VPAPGAVERLQVATLEANGAGGRVLEPEHELCRRGFAAARFPDDAERSPWLD